MAYALLGLNSAYLGQTGLAAENTRKPYELRDRVSERERLFIESNYYFLVTGNLEKRANLMNCGHKSIREIFYRRATWLPCT